MTGLITAGVVIPETTPNVVALDIEGVFGLEYRALKTLTEAKNMEREKGLLAWPVGLAPGGRWPA